MKTLGEDYDVESAQYHNNYDEMQALNRELDHIVEQTLQIP